MSPADLAVGDTPRIFLYDAYPGGIGFSEPLFSMHVDLLTRTRELIAECPCDNGCPSCVGPVGQTGPLAKTVALRILDHLNHNQLRDVSSPRPMSSIPELPTASAGSPPGDEMPF